MSLDFAKAYADVFQEELAENQLLNGALNKLLQEAEGPVFVTGSALYGNIIKRIHKHDIPIEDFDFVVTTRADWDRTLPSDGWERGIIQYGEPEYHGEIRRFSNGNIQMDVGNLMRYNPPRIETLLAGAPMTVQSIAYDARKGIIIGEIGQRAIRERTVEVNGREDAEFYARVKRMTIEQLVREKAKQLGFTPR